MIARIVRKIGAAWLFLILVCLLYLAVAAFDPGAALAGLRSFLTMGTRIVPVLAVVFALLFLFNLFVEAETVTRLLGRGRGVTGWLIAIASGIVSAGPIYLWYPLLSDLKEKGMRDALIAAFLYNRAVKIPLLPVMVYYFGVELVAVLTVYMVLFSVIAGWVVERLTEGSGASGPASLPGLWGRLCRGSRKPEEMYRHADEMYRHADEMYRHERGTSMKGKNVCRWYDGTSGMKRAYDAGMLDRKWIDEYCLNGGRNCVRKKRFEEEGYVSPDYVLPDGTVDEKLKRWVTGK